MGKVRDASTGGWAGTQQFGELERIGGDELDRAGKSPEVNDEVGKAESVFITSVI